MGRCISGFGAIPGNFDHWIVKYRNKDADPQDMGRIELAYSRMAYAAGVTMPPTMLVPATVRGKQESFFAVQRFDRVGNTRRHVISLGGMLELTHRAPSIDYANLLKAVGFATKDTREVTKAFRLMVFNVLAHNKDDHVKNFSFLREGNRFVLTPAYDLTFSAGMNNMHTTAIDGQGRPPLASVLRPAPMKTITAIIATINVWIIPSLPISMASLIILSAFHSRIFRPTWLGVLLSIGPVQTLSYTRHEIRGCTDFSQFSTARVHAPI